jgi:uncharacterized protein involved in exopolysaccharide biosynthesis
MTLHDVFRRVILQHKLLIAAAVVVAVGGFLAVHHSTPSYTATTRLVLDAADPSSRQESSSLADTAKAIATSPAQVGKAIAAAHVSRDAADVAKHSVSLQALGAGGVLQLSVSDPEPRVAAALANALAARVIATRLDVTRGEARATVDQITARLAALNRRIARASEPSRTLLVAQRSALQAEQIGLLDAQASKLQPQVISAAQTPTHADPSHLLVDLVLALVLGAILGVALAGIRETLDPAVVGDEALAGAFEAPFLGSLEALPRTNTSTFDGGDLAQRIALAARAAGKTHVELVSVDSDLDLRPLATKLERALGKNGQRAHGAPKIATFTPAQWNGSTPALVVVTPERLTQRQFQDAANLLWISRADRIGVVSYGRDGRDAAKRAAKSIRPAPARSR